MFGITNRDCGAFIRGIVFCLLFAATSVAQDAYYPAEWGSWESADPATLGFDSEKLQAAVEFAKANENK